MDGEEELRLNLHVAVLNYCYPQSRITTLVIHSVDVELVTCGERTGAI